MMSRLKPVFYNGTGRRKGIPKGVDETHPVLICATSHTVATALNCCQDIKPI